MGKQSLNSTSGLWTKIYFHVTMKIGLTSRENDPAPVHSLMSAAKSGTLNTST